MKNKFRKTLSIFINIGLVFMLLFNMNVVKAATSVHLSLLADDYNPTLVDWDSVGPDYGESEYESADGSIITLNALENGSKVKAGQVIRVNVMLDFQGGTTTNSNYDLFLSYDKNQLTYLTDPDTNVVYYEATEAKGKNFDGNTDYYGIFPAKGTSGTNKTSTDWNFGGGITVSAQYAGFSGRTFVAMPTLQAGTGNKVLNNKGIIVALYFTVNNDVAPGTTILLDLPTSGRTLGNNIFASTSIGLTSESLSLVVEGDAPTFDGTLSSLTLTGSGHDYMTGKFDAAKETYSVSDGLVVPNSVSSIQLGATTVDTTSGLVLTYGKKGVTGSNATQSLDVGNNELYVVVSSPEGQEKIYTLNVKRLSNSASITAVSGTYGSTALTFDANGKANVPSSTTSVKILASTQGALTKITSAGVELVNNNLVISSATTTFTVSVTPENALSEYASVYGNIPSAIVEKTYTINRQNGDATLSSLIVDGKEYFVIGTKNYSVPVLSNATTATVKIQANDSKATIDLFASPYQFTQTLQTGNTTKTFKVYAEDGTTTDYHILFVRQADTDNTLSDLKATVNGSQMISDFSASKDTYNLGEINYVENGVWSIAATATSSKATLTGLKTNEKLVVGLNTAQVVVKAEDGSTKTYTVTLTMKANTNAEITDGIKVGNQDAENQGIVNGKHQYYIQVPYEKTQISMSDFTLTLPSGASVQTSEGTKALQVGENTYEFTIVAGDGSTTEKYLVVIERAKSKTALLESLTIVGNQGGTMNPSSFASNTKTYVYNVPATTTSYTITALAKEDGLVDASTVGVFTLNSSSYDHLVMVTSQDGTITSEYKIQIRRAASGVNTLSALSMNGDAILEQMVGRQYTTTLLNEVDEVTFAYETSDSKAKVMINGSADKTFELAYGENTFNITVTAEDNTTLTYNVKVTRERSKEARLNSLSVNGVMISQFDSNTYDYVLADVAYEVESLNIGAVAVDNDATVSISAMTLNVGENTITVTVTAADQKTQAKYTIKVKREKSNSSKILSLNPTAQATQAGHVMSKIDDTHYVVSVPYGTTAYDYQSFNVGVLTDSNIVYQEQPVNLKGTEPFVYKFSVTSPLGNSTTEYEIKVVVEASLYPHLLGVGLNGEPLSPFDGDQLTQPEINIDTYLETNKTVVELAFEVEDGVVVVGGEVQSVNMAGLVKKNIEITLQQGSYVSVYHFTLTHTLSTDASLSSLTSNVKSLDIGLTDNPNGPFEVRVGSDVTSITFIATTTHSGAKMVGLGPYTDLKPGKNIKTIYVTPEDGSQAKAYSIIVYRDLALASLKVGQQTIDITQGTMIDGILTYTLDNLPASYSSALVSATANDASVAMSGEVNKTISIAKGDDSIDFTLTSQDGNTSLKVKIITKRLASSDARLKTLALTIDGQAFEETFDPDVYEYHLNLPYSISLVNPAVDFVWTTQHENTTVTLPSPFAITETEVHLMEIKSVAEDGSEKIYKVYIQRESYNYLSSLSVGQAEGMLNETFNPDVQTYTATIYPNVETFRIYYTVDSAYDGVYIENEAALSNLKSSDLPMDVDVIVVAKNGEKRIYTIAVDTGLSARLSSLTPSVGSINFNPNTQKYTMDVAEEVTSISFDAIAEDSSAQVSGSFKNVVLDKEVTTVSILVKNGNYQKTYQVDVVRKINETALESVMIKQDGKTWTPVYDDSKKQYTAEVERGVDLLDLEVIATGMSDQTRVEVSNPEQVSENEVKYTVISTDKHGNTSSYTIIVKHLLSDNNNLSDLKIKGETITGFDKGVLSYEYTILDDASFDVTAVAEDEKASVNLVYPEVFEDGAIINIEVTSELGITKTYQVALKRQLNQVALLSQLSVDQGVLSPQFNELVNEYYVNVSKNINTINVQALAKENGSVKIIGGDQLVEGENTIEVLVTAENGATNTYYIYVTKAKTLNNPLENITVTGENHGTYSISPSFNSSQRDYTVELERDENTVEIEVVVGENLRVTGIGSTTLTTYPAVHEIRVFNSDNEVEVYTITFTQKPSDNNNLANLWTDQGYFDQVFNANTTGYTLSVGASVEQVEILYTMSEANQVVNGAGIQSLKEGRNHFNVSVQAEDGQIKTYTVTIIRGSSLQATLENISVSEGELSPAFKPTTTTYYVQVDESIDSLVIDATAKEGVTVSGTGEVTLAVGSNTFDVIADDGVQTTTYSIVVNRGEVKSTYLSRFSLKGYPSEEDFVKTTFDYHVNIHDSSVIIPKVIAVAEDPNATVTLDAPEQLEQGQYVIKATVTLPSGESQVYTMNVDLFVYKIRSEIHDVGETYILSIHAEQRVSDVKSQMLNEESTLQIFFKGEKLEESALVPSGAIIKLIVNDVTYDQKTLIVRGDANQDGRIGVGDVQVMRTYVLGSGHDEIALLTADVNRDETIGVGDIIAVRSHILKTYDLYGEGE